MRIGKGVSRLVLLVPVAIQLSAQTEQTSVSPLSFRGNFYPFTDTLFLRSRGAPIRQIDAATDATNGGSLLYVVNVANGRSVDSVWLARPSLAPIRHIATAGAQYLDVQFTSDSVRGIAKDSTGEHRVARAGGSGMFDFSSLTLWLRHMAVLAGDQGSLSTVDVDYGLRQLPYSVASEDSLEPGEPPGVLRITVDFGRWKTSYRIQPERHLYLGYDLLIDGQPRAFGARRAPPAQ